MKRPIDLPIYGPSNAFPQDDPQYTLNMYPEQVDKDIYTLKPTPGRYLDSQCIGNGGGRNSILVGSRFFAVRGSFFQEKVAGVWTNRGNLSSTSGYVGMIQNLATGGSQILIVDDSHGYTFELGTNAFTLLLASGGFVGGGSQAAFCAGRAVVFKPGTLQWQCSALNDFTTWSGLDVGFKTCNDLVGEILAMTSNGNLLYFFSSTGFDVWQDNGDGSGIPYSLVLQGYKYGILAPVSLVFSEIFVYWLGTTSEGQGVIYRQTGSGLPQRISDHPFERQIASLTNPSDAVGLVYNSLGHVFYQIIFQAGNLCKAWDKTTGFWHDRAIREPLFGALKAPTYISFTFDDGSLYALDAQDGSMWIVSDLIYQDAGNPIIRRRILTPFPGESGIFRAYYSAQLYGEYGNTPVRKTDPLLTFYASGDRGKTYGLPDVQPIGGQSSYAGITQFNGLGSFFTITMMFEIIANQYVSWRKVQLTPN